MTNGNILQTKGEKNQRLSKLTKGRFVVFGEESAGRVHMGCSIALKRHQVKARASSFLSEFP